MQNYAFQVKLNDLLLTPNLKVVLQAVSIQRDFNSTIVQRGTGVILYEIVDDGRGEVLVPTPPLWCRYGVVSHATSEPVDFNDATSALTWNPLAFGGLTALIELLLEHCVPFTLGSTATARSWMQPPEEVSP